ncbi:MAG TPA: hypothetical protein VF585_06950, partial [Chthoniobacterales bacterium]
PDGKSDSGTTSWPQQLHSYAASWKVFKSPFDKRATVEGSANSGTAPISYGINGKKSLLGVSASKINYPTSLILFASSQKAGAGPEFAGVSKDDVIVEPGTAAGGTHLNRTRISAVFADGHAEDMLYSKFKDDSTASAAGGGKMRWVYDDDGQ